MRRSTWVHGYCASLQESLGTRYLTTYNLRWCGATTPQNRYLCNKGIQSRVLRCKMSWATAFFNFEFLLQFDGWDPPFYKKNLVILILLCMRWTPVKNKVRHTSKRRQKTECSSRCPTAYIESVFSGGVLKFQRCSVGTCIKSRYD